MSDVHSLILFQMLKKQCPLVKEAN